MNQTVKPELKSQEMKAKYFYLHYGQPVFKVEMLSKLQSKPHAEIMDDDYLLLTSLDQISNEQAIYCCRFKNEMSFMTTKKWTVERKEHYALITSRYSSHSFSLDFISGDVEFYNDNEIEVTISDTTKDYLRSIGMACPYLGHSVQQLIEAGYMKLREGGEKK